MCRTRLIAWLSVVLLGVPGVRVSAATIQPKGFDSRSIAAAVAQAAPGDTVQLAAGVYELTEAVALKSKVKLIGAGQEKTRLVYRGSRPASFISIVRCEDAELGQMTLDGQENPLVHQGISGSDSRRLWLHHLTICNLVKSDTFGPHGVLFSGDNPTMKGGVSDSVISDCRMENIGVGAEYGGGIRLNWGSMRNVVQGNIIHKTGRGGIFGDHSPELVIRKNQVSGSGGEGLGIEIWGGCVRSLIEDNTVDHWISVDQGNQSAVRRNTIGTDDGTLKGYGIEIIARDMVVTDNVVKRGARTGLSVSNAPVKNNVFWGYNTVSDCIQWGAQLQGEAGGIARQYFYRCVFEKTVRGDERAEYPKDSGHGFRTNGDCRSLVLEECTVRDNGGLGVQLGGENVDLIRLVCCTIAGNGQAAMSAPSGYTAMETAGCKVEGNGDNQMAAGKAFAGASPTAAFSVPAEIHAGEAVAFECTSSPNEKIVERLWDLGDGIPEMAAQVEHTYARPGKYRVTLIVWDSVGHGARAEKTIEVLPAGLPAAGLFRVSRDCAGT